MYQLQFEPGEQDLSQSQLPDIMQRYQHLQATIGHLHSTIQIMIDLHQPNQLVQDGGFVILFLYGHWHLLTVVDNTIKTVHFMLADGPWRLWSSWRSAPQVKSFSALGHQFAREVQQKILLTAAEYLVWLDQGMTVIGGPTSDMLRRSAVPQQAEQFVQLIQAAMAKEKIGLAFCFPD
jgi:hypothetical protein